MSDYEYIIENEQEDDQYEINQYEASRTELTPQQKEEVIREFIEFMRNHPYNKNERELIGDMVFFLGMYRETIDPTKT